MRSCITLALCEPAGVTGVEIPTPPTSPEIPPTPPMESSSTSVSLTTYRNRIAVENESELFDRIKNLEQMEFYNLPPQNNAGDYQRLVREHFEQALNVPHYIEIYDQEFFEIKVLEQKGLLQDRLFHLMLTENNLKRIMEISPYTNIRKEAFDFIEDKLESVSALRHAFQRNLMEGNLTHFIQELHQKERESEVYVEFYRYFIDYNFRQKYGLDLP
ncbi:Uncharacterized protein Adt_21392 [Abeliophyllum distichum]|uniref:Uncharacterized protein n=1 Tax=Abeliophyllum distichum TaxID=126358 RepID=A0ABD1SZ74_9LAMI